MSQGERRLAAVMFADMVGYQEALLRDESLGRYLLERERSVIRQVSSGHGGRYFGEELVAAEGTGLKGWLTGGTAKIRETKLQSSESVVLFESALDATRCAVEVQRTLREYNREAPNNKDIYVRIGIHVGEVTERGREISGEAVAIASRLAPMAEPGGICISEKIYPDVRDKLGFPVVGLGGQELKNVELLTEAYKLVLPWKSQSPSKRTALDPHRIAILPLANISADPNDQYFADGMTEQMISTLSRIQELKVIARTSIMQYKGVGKSVAEIGQALNVGTVLEGSVRKASSRLRITVQLISTDTEEHIWAEDYDRDLQDVFAIQSEIAEKVAEQLQVKLLGRQKVELEKWSTKDVDAFTLYLKGRFYWNERTEEGMKKAITYFEKATEKDPNYALAYSGMADCYSILAYYGLVEPRTTQKKARELAMRALELDDTLSEAHASLAGILYASDWDWSRAEAELRRAIELNPNYATARHWLSINLSAQGKHDEAVSQIRTALELDPLSKQIQVAVADAYWRAHRDDEAIQELRRAIETDPNFYNFHDYLGLIYAKTGRAEEGIAELEKAVSLAGKMLSLKADLGYVYAKAGKRMEAKEVLEELLRVSKDKYVSPLYIARVYVGLGELEDSLAWIERAFQERDSDFINEVTGPTFDELRPFPRFMAIIRKLGLT